MEQEELVGKIHTLAESISEDKVYFTLREMRGGKTTPQMVELTKYCIALNHFGLPVTTKLTKYFLGTGVETLTSRLHNLGDRGVLVLVRDRRKEKRWLLSSLFKNKLEGWI